MLHIKQIMKLLKVDQDTAFRVFDLMEIDFSGCSQREFNAAARAAYAKIA